MAKRLLELRRIVFFFLPVILASMLQSCSSYSAPTQNSVVVSISPTTPTIATGKTQQFSATVTNATNTAVTWQVSGGVTNGTISTSGLYTAPTAVPTPATVTVTAASQADPSKSASTTVTITSAATISVAISPTAASVQAGGTQGFTASVTNDSQNKGVSWSLSGAGCSGTACGTLSNVTTSGVTYSSPTTVPNPASVTLKATSLADGTKSSAATLTITSAAAVSVAISPTAATVQTGGTQGFTASVTNDSQNKGVSWSLSGAGCSGTACGTLSNVTTSGVTYSSPTTVPNPASVTLKATSLADGTKSGAATITVTSPAPTPSNITVKVTPKRGGLTTSQALSVEATLQNDTNDKGVTWSATGGGSFSPTTSTSGKAVTFTAPAAAGVVTITATSIADGSKDASATIGVTDLPGVSTYLNGNTRQGANLQEHALATSGPTAVNSTNFGKLFSCSVDAAIYAQPLWVAKLSFASVLHNVVFVATQHDTVYAFDADANPCVPLWQASLLDTAHGGSAGETWVTSADESGCGDLAPAIGIVGTPVIDLTSKTLYVVSKTKNSGGYHQRIHALDITSGNEKVTPPKDISATVSGTGVGSSGGQVSFDAKLNNQRAALLLVNGHVIISWAAHCDFGPYHGWVMSYNASTLAQDAVINLSPNGNDAGVWMSGNGPSADSSGNIYLATGNGTFDANNATAPNNDYGDSIVKLGPPSGGTFPVLSYFTPSNQQVLDAGDVDQGSGGTLLLPDVTVSSVTKSYLVQAGKDGNIYLADRSSLGAFNSGSNNVVQEVSGQIPGGMWGSPTYWNGSIYFGAAQDPQASSDPMRAFSFNAGNSGLIGTTPTSTTSSTKIFGFSGPTPPISSNGTNSGIVWALDNSGWSSTCPTSCQVLYAYDATNLATMLYNSNQASGRDQGGGAVKFTVPTVANGKVYVGGQNTLTVYGLLPTDPK